MGTQDISRSAFDPRKQYTGVRMQQGRVIVDDDWNEHARINEEDERRARAEIVGPVGSPDDGFRIENPRVDNDNQITFDIRAGTFYVGGLRLELAPDQTFREQTDWLQYPADKFAAPTSERYDLVYLESYEVPVTAVEDRELFEVALGGPDTSTRTRLMQRVVLETGIGARCDEAWQALVEKWEECNRGPVTAEHELKPNVWLKVECTDNTGGDDLCSPQTVGGYLGAENQAIRVQLTAADRLIWGFDNAAPLYRVKVSGTERKELEMLTEPKDEAHWPIAGQVVEVLPCAAVLPNGEKIAEIKGHLTRVEEGYDPDKGKGTITLKDRIPIDGFGDWTKRVDEDAPETDGVIYYLRVWNQGSAPTEEDHESEPDIEFKEEVPLELGHTGLKITITDSDRNAGDYWIIAARPETPNKVVPWGLEEGRRPHGVRRFVAPLAVLHWETQSGKTTASARDCRPHFRSLTHQRTCCYLMVGDGSASHGDFDSLESAVAHLPDDGGQICLLPGLHETNVVLERRRNVTIRGCDRQAQVVPSNPNQPICRIRDSHSVKLENLQIVTDGGSAIVLEGTTPGSLTDVEICDSRVAAHVHTIGGKGAEDVRIHHNVLRVFDTAAGGAVIRLLAQDAMITDNEISVVELGDPSQHSAEALREAAQPQPSYHPAGVLTRGWRLRASRARAIREVGLATSMAYPIVEEALGKSHAAQGGIQIESGSEQISIRHNVIRGGAGNGITLGSDLDVASLSEDRTKTHPSGRPAKIVTDADQIRGRVMLGNQPVAHVGIVVHGSGSPSMAITDERGRFVVDLDPSVFASDPKEYRVMIADANYRVSDIVMEKPKKSHRQLAGDFYRVQVVREGSSTGLEEVLAFIYGMDIAENTIVDMGASGIGIPQVQPEFVSREDLGNLIVKYPRSAAFLLLAHYFGILSGFLVDATIRGNRIADCLTAGAPRAAKGTVVERGVGGISLGLCDHLVIQENTIARNGIGGSVPVCGIFVLMAEQVAVTRNEIVDNGPLGFDVADTKALSEGIRGGIVVLAASTLSIAPDLNTEYRAESRGDQAARIVDNIVDQPIGRGLLLGAYGPVVINGNRINSNAAGPNRLDLVGAGVLVVNLGGVERIELQQRVVGKRAGMRRYAMLSSPKITVVDGKSSASAYREFPSGETQFSNNQVRVGTQRLVRVAQIIVTADDLGFLGNQSAVYAAPPMITKQPGIEQINSLLFGSAVRAGWTRFREPLFSSDSGDDSIASLVSVGLEMNNTYHNQGEHCIIALRVPEICPQGQGVCVSMVRPPALQCSTCLVSEGNQSLVPKPRMCKRLADNWNANPLLLLETLLSKWTGGPSALLSNTFPEAIPGLKLLQDTQSIQHALCGMEAQRMTAALGQDHRRVRRLNAWRGSSRMGAQRLQSEIERASIQVPELADDDVLIHGRIRDDRALGVAGLEVVIEDETGRPIRALGAATTNAAGYYAFKVDPKTAEGLADKPAFLTLRTRAGEVIHQATEPVRIARGEEVYGEMMFARADVQPSRRSPAQPDSEHWTGRGVVHDENGKPLAGLMVKLLDKDLLYDDLLGAELTDDNGQFEITYDVREFREGDEPGPDLYITVKNAEGEILYTSEEAVRHDAGSVAEFDITIKQEGA